MEQLKEQVVDTVQEHFLHLSNHLNSRILGQKELISRLMIALLADGHLLVEGAPGLAKTRAVKELSESIEGDFHRIQFTPDLLPGDLTGTDVYHPQNNTLPNRESGRTRCRNTSRRTLRRMFPWCC